ncbi:Hypothetical predicted protein [Mytilus galloprovincialis]|uniref:DUF5050 domain-containing protein n=1 Tax=Mytilus galloprovincialis TaxID=29158 RepID=A0A8B6FF00_MYTGA|nr:Hypothetical predicted protein [Mytilus galloprovincialis]
MNRKCASARLEEDNGRHESKRPAWMADYVEQKRNRLLILKEDGTLNSEIRLSSKTCNYPLDVTCIDDNTAAVTLPGLKQILIINILTDTIESIIETTSYCHGICYSDGHLFYCETGRGIQKVNVSGSNSSTLVNDKTLFDWSYVTTSKDKIFYTNSSTDTVTCCTFTGEKIWEYKDKSVRSTYGIAVDKDSNVYFTSCGSHSLIVLSSDGKQARKLLGKEDGIDKPFGLAFDVKKEVL